MLAKIHTTLILVIKISRVKIQGNLQVATHVTPRTDSISNNIIKSVEKLFENTRN